MISWPAGKGLTDILGRLFGPVWSVLYIAMGIAAWLVWSKGGWTPNKVALSAFAVQVSCLQDMSMSVN